MRRLGALLLMLALWAGSAPAGSAANTTAAVQAEVERALARLVRLDPSQGLSYGAIEVVPLGSGYGVTIADVTTKLAASDPGMLDIGIVNFRLTPVGGDAYRVDHVTAADEFTHRDSDGRIDGVWRLVSRRLSGLWSRQQGGFLGRDAAIDLSLAVTGLDNAINAVASAATEPGFNRGWIQLTLFRSLAQRETAPD